MDGYEVLRTMKADPATSDIPVLVVSAHDFDRPIDLAGFIGALRKPFDLPLLPAMLSLVGG
jgi:CheY-like chemotaxis protein